MNEQTTPQTQQAAPQTKELKGIGGWLLVYVIWIFVGIALILLYWLSLEALVIKHAALVKQDPKLASILLMIRITSIIVLVLGVAQLVVIFMKMKWVPKAIMVLLASGIVVNIITIVLSGPATTGSIVRGIIVIILNLLWIGYFAKSVRVKNTFVK